MAFPVQAILCAVDFSPYCDLICEHGVALARRAGVPLYLFHAVHHPQDRIHPTLAAERGDERTRLAAEAGARMDHLMRRHAVAWEAVVRFGDPVEQTTAVVNALPPCLVVSASHGVSGFRRFFIGTVVERLTRMLDCPMLVVKARNGSGDDAGIRFRSTVVSCDAYGHWQRLPGLLNLLQPDPDASVHLVHALEGPAESVPEASAVSYAHAQQAFQDRLIRQYRQQAQRLFPDRQRVFTLVAPGEPEEMVLRTADAYRADLIVVGVRPSRRMGRWIAGSTTESLLRHGSCCVLTVPEPRHP